MMIKIEKKKKRNSFIQASLSFELRVLIAKGSFLSLLATRPIPWRYKQ